MPKLLKSALVINKWYKNLKNVAKFVTDQQNLFTAMYCTHTTAALIYGLPYQRMFALLMVNFIVRWAMAKDHAQPPTEQLKKLLESYMHYARHPLKKPTNHSKCRTQQWKLAYYVREHNNERLVKAWKQNRNQDRTGNLIFTLGNLKMYRLLFSSTSAYLSNKP
jgi:hypothetical protein